MFSNFRVALRGGRTHSVEIRDLRSREFSCDCEGFRLNGLGSCRHVEAVLLDLRRRFKRPYEAAAQNGSERVDLVPDAARNTIRLHNARRPLPKVLRSWFNEDGFLRKDSLAGAVAALARLRHADFPELRVSQELVPWLKFRRRMEERRQLRREYERRAQSEEWPAPETKVSLLPDQREGMLHLAFTERALLVAGQGPSRAIPAIAACALLHRLRQAERVLVVTPASLRTAWDDQIRQFTGLPGQHAVGSRLERLRDYDRAGARRHREIHSGSHRSHHVSHHTGTQSLVAWAAADLTPCFTLIHYEQLLTDSLELNARLRPDIVVLDEAHRLRNWSARIIPALKRLRSRYAFVLMDAPIENRPDELYELMDFIEPSLLSPRFRFDRDYYAVDDRGRLVGYRNLDRLHERIRPWLFRCRPPEMEANLPNRPDRNRSTPLNVEEPVESNEPAPPELVCAGQG